jgi:uncharacterized membrane protein
MSRKFLVQYIVAASLAFAACGDDGDDETTPTDGAVPAADAAVSDAGAGGACDGLTYEKDIKAILTSGTCLTCHSATPVANSVKLDTLPNVKSNKNDIIAHAIEPRQEPKMPLTGNPLPAADQAKLKKWLECGAP